MKLKQRNGLRILQSEEDIWLIKQDGDLNTICKELYLGNADRPDNYREITDAEKTEMESGDTDMERPQQIFIDH